MQRLLYIVPLLTVFWLTDQWLTDDRTIGWERNSVRNSLDRWENENRAQVAILGSSTSKDWLPGRVVERLLGAGRGQVVDAHINGCHQGCTWSSVRKMLQRHRQKRCRWRGKDRCLPPTKKRFKAVLFGTNLFQMCEDGHSKRVLQHQALLPSEDIPALFSIYREAKQPLEYIGRFAGMKLSGAYGDTRAVQGYWGARLLGGSNPRHAHRWYRRQPKRSSKELLSCDYVPDNVALKLKFTEALMDDLHDLTDRVYVMLLPDRSRASKDPEQQRRWQSHIAKHREIARTRPWVRILDLTDPEAIRPNHFRDGFHLKPEQFKAQQKRLERALKSIGEIGVLKQPKKGER
ncbi:MAG: hypothetical protein ACON3Z_17690 [Bradymonadia bacterium]